MTPDTRPAATVRAELHAVADIGRYRPDLRLVRGIDRFAYTPTREPGAVVWVANRLGLGAHHTELVPLTQIKIFPGRTR